MSNHLYQLLSRWHPQRDETEWVLVTVVRVLGSNYRRPGAMMLISGLGETLGLISGGCLEKSLLNSVKKVLSSRESLLVEIDSSVEGNLPALGCGGQVSLWLQPVFAENAYQALDQLFEALTHRQPISYGVSLANDSANQILKPENLPELHPPSLAAESKVLVIQPKPPRHLGIFGAGVDAKPLAAMAHLMGWQITVVENRTGFGAAQDFPHTHILRADADSNPVKSLVKQLDAAVVMSHNLALDSAAIRQVLGVDYVGLLGPTHRREKVFAMAELKDDPCVRGPMGLNLGGDLPEAIALSVIAQIHQVLEMRDHSQADNKREP